MDLFTIVRLLSIGKVLRIIASLVLPFYSCLFLSTTRGHECENALDKLKREARERKLERKAKIGKREQMEREKVEHVHLTIVAYIEPLALCEPIINEIRICEQEQKSKELEEELKKTFNFFRQTITSTTTSESRIIGLSDSNLEVEIIPQPIAKKQSPQALELKHVEK